MKRLLDEKIDGQKDRQRERWKESQIKKYLDGKIDRQTDLWQIEILVNKK